MLKTVRKTIANNSVLKRLTRSDDGMVLIWVAVLLPVIFGFTALAVDAAYLFAAKSRAQAAAVYANTAKPLRVKTFTPASVNGAVRRRRAGGRLYCRIGGDG